MPYSLDQLNQMSQSLFTETLGSIFEHTPSIACRTWEQRPFQDVTDLHQKMVAVVKAFSPEEKLLLIQAHPDLGSKAKMAEASVKEQAGAGLTQLAPDEYERFLTLNQAYKTQFGFPFIIAVKNHTKASILNAFEERLQNSKEAEMNQAIAEICQIAYFRLTDLIEI